MGFFSKYTYALGNTSLIRVGAFCKGFAKNSRYLFMSIGFFLWPVAARMGVCELKGGKEPNTVGRKAYGEVSGINRKSLN